MTFTPKTWLDGPSGGTPVTAAELNRIEAGVSAAVPKWQPNTAYTAGDPVVNPTGQLVTANASFTSGATYSAGNWTVTAGGGGSTTDASLLTAGTLAPARIADGSLPAAKLDFAANGAFTRSVVNGSSTTTPRPAGAGMVIWVGSVASVNMADGDIRISTS